MKRNPRKLAWTKSFRVAHNKEMVVDSTLAFSARRNVPVTYNRELVQKTLSAMSRVEEIRRRRERQFYRERMRGNKERQRAADKKLVEENQHLLPPEERDVVPEHYLEKMKAREAQREELVDVQEMDEEISELEEERAKIRTRKPKVKKRQRLVVGQGPEDMDVDG